VKRPLLVASDVHLSAEDPAGVRRFVGFLEGPAAASRRLVLAGDLFDVWVSPSQARDPGLRPAFVALRRLVASGVEVGFVEGNRDFSAGPELREAGVAPLPDVLVVEDGPLRVAVTHGDLLCRRDVRYQAFRRVARTSFVRHLLRIAPERLAGSAGRAARAGSRLETARKAYGTMGLDPLAVAGLVRRTDATAVVCGHVHWGQRHAIEVDGVVRDVVVLGAWDSGDASYAEVGGGTLRFVRFAGPPRRPQSLGAAPGPG
jgi:UDP-2,3-diacylglucosamine hydrolase